METQEAPQATPQAEPGLPADSGVPSSGPENFVIPSFFEPGEGSDLADLFDDSDLPPAGQRHGHHVQTWEGKRVESTPGTENKEAQTAEKVAESAKPAETKPEQPAPDASALILGKYKTQADLEHGYQELYATAAKKAQEFNALRDTLGESDPAVIKKALEDSKWVRDVYEPWAKEANQQGLKVGQKAPAQEQAPVDPAADNERLLDTLTRAPREFGMEIVKAVLEQHPELVAQAFEKNPDLAARAVPELGAMRAERTLMKEFTALEAKYSDARQILPVMEELYKEDPHRFVAKSLDDVYHFARSRQLDRFTAQRDTDIKEAARVAREQAAVEHGKKLKATVEGSTTTQPGQASSSDEIDEWLNEAEKRTRITV